MQLKSEYDEFKRLRLILGKQKVQKLKNLTILVVGVGGIGCEILKNLSKHPLKKVVIIDLDIIEISNLNRQFYFRNEHLSLSKAKIARQQILKLVPNFNIEAIQGNIYDKQFDNFHFYSQFDVVISALDNLKARQHLAKNCTRYGKVLIDAGTSGFNGQSYTSVRFVVSCHNCYPSVQEETFAVCTIRSRPERSIQCAIYAKHIYEQLFGNYTEPVNNELNQIRKRILNSFSEQSEDKLRKEGIYLFDYIFCHQFKSHEPEKMCQINLLTFKQASKSTEPLQPYLSDAKDDSIWSLREYSQAFLDSFVKLTKRVHKLTQNGFKKYLVYDKDDYECSLFICCVCNLRVYNFKNQNKKSTKLKYLTFHECRKLIGKIIPAIASTNSIAASLQVKQLTDLFSQHQNLKYFTISPTIDQKISFSWLSLPNPQCEVCSPYNIYFQVKCSLNRTTFQEFQQFAFNHLFSFNRDIYCQNMILIKNVNAKKISPNKQKSLNFKSELIVANSLTLIYLPTSQISDLNVEITLIDVEFAEQDKEQKFKILNRQQVENTLEVLKKYRESKSVSFTSKKLQNLSGFENQQYIA